MRHGIPLTADEDRPISLSEAEIVTWLLRDGSVARPLAHLAPSVPALRVVGRCTCGCPSVDFVVRGQTSPAEPIAEATGRTADGTMVGVMLWGLEDRITGLEIYEPDRAVSSLPLLSTLRAW